MSQLRIQDLRTRGVHAPALQIHAGDCVALYGPSGSGKTLLLRAIADLDEASGDVWLNDRPRSEFSGPDWRRRVMYLAAESHWWNARVRDHATDWRPADLDALGFDADALDLPVQRLSSGERQRLALARALAHRPSVLLLDEPSANLDGPNTERLEHLVSDWRAASGGGVLWVSHDPQQRGRVASRQYRMLAGELTEASDD